MIKADPTLLRITLIEAFDKLLASLEAFSSCLRNDTNRPLWVSLTEQEIADKLSMRQKTITLYQALWYEDGQEGRSTLTCPGLIGASSAVINAAKDLNDAKDAFKDAILQLKALKKSQADAMLADLHSRNEDVAQTMRRVGMARLNLKQAYRHIPYLDNRPIKVGFTWSKQGRTIQRTTVAEARRLLERRKETPEIIAELRRLAQIPEQEILARVRSVSPHLRANIVFAKPDQPLERRLMQAPLPILIPLADSERLPDFVPIPPEPVGQVRLKRSDVKIDPEPFLPLIRLHRYLN